MSIDSDAMGALAETALVSQYLYAPIFGDLCFARWAQGEVDLVRVDQSLQRVLWALEVKWSDRAFESAEAWSGLLDFGRGNGLDTVHMTSRTMSRTTARGGLRAVVHALPELCYQIGTLAARQRLVRDRSGLPESSAAR